MTGSSSSQGNHVLAFGDDAQGIANLSVIL